MENTIVELIFGIDKFNKISVEVALVRTDPQPSIDEFDSQVVLCLPV